MNKFRVYLLLEGESPEDADDSYEYDMVKDVEVAAEDAGFKILQSDY